MNAILFGTTMVVLSFTACTGSTTKSDTANINIDTTANKTSSTIEQVDTISATEIVTHYLHLKNALANDNAKEAAIAGKAVAESIQKMSTATLTAEPKKVFDDVKDDMKEHAEHIADNGDKIEHQREHFETLSDGLYDLVKAMGAGQTLYKDHCPMYNGNKGANWLSEVKEIKNPYLGKKMPDCGTVKEEIK